MTTIDLKDWKGDELHSDFMDFVVEGTLEAKAIASYVTGRMYNSVRINQVSDGFEVVSSRNALRAYMGIKREGYYPYTYAVKGYRRFPAFHFIAEGFDNVADGEFSYRGGRWRAVKPSGRNGSGTSYLGSENTSFVASQRSKFARQGESRTRPARMLFSKLRS